MEGGKCVPVETAFDVTFVAELAVREKQIQQSYRPIIGVHKWFARRPGSLFRSLQIAEFAGESTLPEAYSMSHNFDGVIGDPFMGGGTPLVEANRLGFNVVGTDVNPMAYWIVRQELAALDLEAFETEAESVVTDVSREIGQFYQTQCTCCGEEADIKYFLWVATMPCPHCAFVNDLFPGYVLAEAGRHPKHVLMCPACNSLVELDEHPSENAPATCRQCRSSIHRSGPARRGRMICRGCCREFRYPPRGLSAPLARRMCAIEYHCRRCKPNHSGRFFRAPDSCDEALSREAEERLDSSSGLPIPSSAIPPGDEADRLHRWGYRHYRDLFLPRQILGLATLLKRIMKVRDVSVRHALLTVFSDTLRYQNMLCRYDTRALKCQDIFSIHGFPTGLVRCENSLLGIPTIGSGGYRHFLKKYVRAKEYCIRPFETFWTNGKKKVVIIEEESIGARFVKTFPVGPGKQALLSARSSNIDRLPPNSLDGVFTDPPYFGNVQYAELIDFCYVWLKLALDSEIPEFARDSTRSPEDITGNRTSNKPLTHFASGLSDVFCTYAKALKTDAPFVFTFHHNSDAVYASVVVAILDAAMVCTATLPAPAEMEASIHIKNTASAVVDTVFVCREKALEPKEALSAELFEDGLLKDCKSLRAGGVRIGVGDALCLARGHLARLCVADLQVEWDPGEAIEVRVLRAHDGLRALGIRLASQKAACSVVARLAQDGCGRALAVGRR